MGRDGGSEGHLPDFESLRATMLAPEEYAFESGLREVAELGQVVDAIGEWTEVALQELRRDHMTKIDPARLFAEYTEGIA